MKENFKKEFKEQIRNTFNDIIKNYGFNNSYAINVIGYEFEKKILEMNALLYETLIFTKHDRQELSEYIREQYERLVY